MDHALFKIYIYFNPRSREGSDGDKGMLILKTMPFQSTLPRGERPTCI